MIARVAARATITRDACSHALLSARRSRQAGYRPILPSVARKGREAMRLARRRRRHAGLILVALCAVSLAGCAPPGPSPNSPQVDETYRQMYRPIIDGG